MDLMNGNSQGVPVNYYFQEALNCSQNLLLQNYRWKPNLVTMATRGMDSARLIATSSFKHTFEWNGSRVIISVTMVTSQAVWMVLG